MANAGNQGGETASRPAQSAQGRAEPARQAEDALRQGAEQIRNHMAGMGEMSTKLSQDLIQRSAQNFEVMKEIAETLASGAKSAAGECAEYAKSTAKRQTEMMQQLASVRSPNDVLEIQNRYIQDNLKELLGFSERMSRLSADKAKEAGDRLGRRG